MFYKTQRATRIVFKNSLFLIKIMQKNDINRSNLPKNKALIEINCQKNTLFLFF